MIIGTLPYAEQSPAWPTISALLQPAADRGGVPVLEDQEVVWIVSEGVKLIAAATTRMTVDHRAEVILVGGTRYLEWLGDMSTKIVSWATDEGAVCVQAFGRRGWIKPLTALGWEVIGEENGAIGYEKALV